MLKRKLTAIVVGLVIFGGALASMAALSVTGGSIGAGSAAVASCDTDGVAVAHTLGFTGGVDTVISTVVSTIGVNTPPAVGACSGKTLTVRLLGSGGVQLATGSAQISGVTETIGFGTPPNAANVIETRVTIA